jgi:hypothetical protein
MTGITSTNTRIWAQTGAYKRISGLCLQPHVLALTGMRVATQDFGRKSKFKILVVTQVVHMSDQP